IVESCSRKEHLSDFPGHCAKYGSYTLIEDRVNKVVDVQLVRSSEVPNSSRCEIEGLKRSIGLLRRHDLHLSTLITDRHRQLCPEGTQHYFDVWHIGKTSKDRQCEQLQLWRPAIVNHQYWTAASTPDGNRARKNLSICMSAVCVSVCVPAYLSWSLAGSMAAVKLEGIITRTSLLKDVRQLSPQHQTYSLEAFHSLILHFAPKHTGFSYHGMYSRLLLAALHYNYNANRETARRSDGLERYSVRYPRFTKGAWEVVPIKEKASYGRQCHAVLSYFDICAQDICNQ
uniref:Uncharacterized protein n=1 Tax=Gadus morhua TaxID=8049 RepID=A0A8C5B2R7_GADMO